MSKNAARGTRDETGRDQFVPARVVAVQQRRRAHAAGPHPLSRDRGTRGQQRRRALADQDTR